MELSSMSRGTDLTLKIVPLENVGEVTDMLATYYINLEEETLKLVFENHSVTQEIPLNLLHRCNRLEK